MAKKKITYRGLEIEELQAKSMDELVKIMPSRARRSLKRGFSEIQKKLLARVKDVRKDLDAGKKVKPIRTECRDMLVLPDMVGMEFEIYNGKEFLRS
jgi:small subunit ribosomal protein S19